MLTVEGHTNIVGFYSPSAGEQKLLDRANAADRDYFVAFLHCAHVPGVSPGTHVVFHYRGNELEPRFFTLLVKPDSLGGIGGLYFLNDFNPLTRTVRYAPRSLVARAIQKVASRVLPQLKNGQNEQAAEGDWLVVMRPVRALQASCLGCHTGAKKGDTLGVMVYAVNQKPTGRG